MFPSMAMAHCGSDSHRAGVDVIGSMEGIIDGGKKNQGDSNMYTSKGLTCGFQKALLKCL